MWEIHLCVCACIWAEENGPCIRNTKHVPNRQSLKNGKMELDILAIIAGNALGIHSDLRFPFVHIPACFMQQQPPHFGFVEVKRKSNFVYVHLDDGIRLHWIPIFFSSGLIASLSSLYICTWDLRILLTSIKLYIVVSISININLSTSNLYVHFLYCHSALTMIWIRGFCWYYSDPFYRGSANDILNKINEYRSITSHN